MSKDGTGGYIAANDIEDISSNVFTVDIHFKDWPFDLGKTAPNDGTDHSRAISRDAKKTRIHGNEYIENVLFCFIKTYGEDGKLETAQYVRADLVKG